MLSSYLPANFFCEGSTTCDAGSACQYTNDWYSQCIPSSSAITTTSRTTTSGSSTISASSPFSSPGALNAKFVAKGKKFWGTCGDSNTLNIAQNAAIIKSDFGALTPENSMKVSGGLF